MEVGCGELVGTADWAETGGVDGEPVQALTIKSVMRETRVLLSEKIFMIYSRLEECPLAQLVLGLLWTIIGSSPVEKQCQRIDFHHYFLLLFFETLYYANGLITVVPERVYRRVKHSLPPAGR